MNNEEIITCKKAVAILRTMLSGICHAVGIDEETEMRVKSHDKTFMSASVKDALQLGDEALTILNTTK